MNREDGLIMRSNFVHRAPEAIVLPVLLAIVGVLWHMRAFVWVAIVAGIAMLVFYRGADDDELERAQKLPSNVIVSPCDGKVLRVIQHDNGWLQVAVFLNIHNVHVQYFPIAGKIKSITHKPGTFHAAYLFEKSQHNERMETVLATEIGDVHVVQIAGLVARRIVAFHKPEHVVKRGEPMGLIKFGSRVDVWLPKHRLSQVHVKEGARVTIGTPLAKYFMDIQ